MKRAILAHFIILLLILISNVLLCCTNVYVMYVFLDGRGKRGTYGYLKYLGDSKRQWIKKLSIYCWEWLCISLWNPGIALLYHIYGKWGRLQITITSLTFTFLGLTVWKENCANINTFSKNATNPKEDAKLLQSRLDFQWPILEFVFSSNGLSPAFFHGLKNPGKSKEEKAAFQHQYLSCVFSLHSLSYHSLFTPHGGRESQSLWTCLPIFQGDEGQQKKEKREGRKERRKETEDTSRRVTLPHHLLYKKAHALIYPEPYTGIVRAAFCLQS